MKQRNRNAFTLIELLIVISIIGVLAGTVLVSSSAGNHDQLVSAARTVAADLRLARSLAVSTGREWTMQFDMGNCRYEIFETQTNNPPPDEYRTVLGTAEYAIDLNAAIPSQLSNINIQMESLLLSPSETSTSEIIFTDLGGTGPARTEDTILMLSIDQSLQIPITVSWITGQVWVGDVTSVVTEPE